MKITVSQEFLKAALKIPVSVAKHANGLSQVLKYILIDVKPGIALLTATDLSVSYRTKIMGVTELSGSASICLPADILNEMVCELKGDINITVHEKGVKITCGKATYNIAGLPKEDFPEIKKEEVIGKAISIKGSALLPILMKALSTTVSKHDNCSYATAVCITGNNKSLDVVGTDGNRLSLTEIPVDGIDGQYIIPYSAAEILYSMTSDAKDDNLIICLNKKFIEMSTADATMRVQLISDMIYPNYRELVVPKSNIAGTITLNVEDLIKTLKRMTTIEASYFAVEMAFEDKKPVTFKCKGCMGTATEELEGTIYNGKKITVGVNGKKLLEMITSVKRDTCTMTFLDYNKPITLTTKESIFIIMPLQLPGVRQDDSIEETAEQEAA